MISFKNYKKVLPAIFILLFCLLMTSFSRGIGESFGVFLLPLSNHFEWSRASVTSVYSIYMFCLGIGSLLSGLAFDRFGSKFNYIFGTFLLTVAYGLSGYLTKLWEFYLFLGVLGGIGASMVGIVPSQSILIKWFDKRLSTALSIAYAGQGLGVLFLAPLCQVLINNFGWMKSYNFIGIFFFIVLFLLIFFPWSKVNTGTSIIKKELYSNKLNNISLKDALFKKTFWIFFFIFLFTAMGIFGVSLQVVAYLIYCGFSEIESAFFFGLMGMLTFPGMAFTGFAADIWKKHYVSTFSYFLSFLGIFSLYILQYQSNYYVLLIFIVTFGLSAGARGPIITSLIAKIFAGKGLASIYGASNLGQGIGAATGALCAGYLFDISTNYNIGFLFCSFFTFIGALLFWFIPGIKKI
ncbi:MAG: hypothetical protein CMN50_02705 [SAR116 cluster bacterium]|nr:hypothetical protein [SAR116 cluster bacterium]